MSGHPARRSPTPESSPGSPDIHPGSIPAEVRRASQLPGAIYCDETPRLTTGIPTLDRWLQGGLRRGSVVSLMGAWSAGTTGCALRLLAAATEQTRAVWIDLDERLDPASLEHAGADLSRVLWVRPPDLRAALRACERILVSRGFSLVAFDLRLWQRDHPPVPLSAWLRLRRSATASGSTLLLLHAHPLQGLNASLAINARARAVHFAGPPPWLQGLRTELHTPQLGATGLSLTLTLDPEVPPFARCVPLRARSPDRSLASSTA